MAFRRRNKSYPFFSQEFLIQNHADIVFSLVILVLIGLMFEVSWSPILSSRSAVLRWQVRRSCKDVTLVQVGNLFRENDLLLCGKNGLVWPQLSLSFGGISSADMVAACCSPFICFLQVLWTMNVALLSFKVAFKPSQAGNSCTRHGTNTFIAC